MLEFLSAFCLICLCSGITGEFYYPDCEYNGLSCLNCHSQKMCMFGWFWSSTPCANDLAGHSNPYCNPNTNTCTNIRPDGCPRITSIECLRNDVFPDTNDCTTYYACINSTAELLQCPQNFVYKHVFGKCVFKLSDDDCMKMDACGLEDFVEQYPGDPSLYYGCESKTFFMKACSSSEFFNTTSETCENICNKIGRLPAPQNCMKYYNCEKTELGFAAIESSCPDDYGFNPISLSCEKGYSVLCNEFAILENVKYDFLSKIPIVSIFATVFRKIFNLLKLNPVRIFFVFRLTDDTISTIILVVDYIYQNKKLPPSTITVLLKLVIDYLPPQLQFVLNLLSQLGIIKLSASTRSSRSISPFSQLQYYLEEKLNEPDFEFGHFLTEVDGININNTGIGEEIFKKILNELDIPREQVPFIRRVLREDILHIISQVNDYIGWPVFIIDEQNNIRIAVDVIDKAVAASELLKDELPESNNYNMKSIKREYLMNREEIDEILNQLYLNLDF